ncbi:MAG: DUF1549 domain-containing protein, partial [Pseudomonadota bacterium]
MLFGRANRNNDATGALGTAEGGAIPAEFQAKNNFDRTESLGTSLMGLSLNCARCHTHKYDPIPQTEYYQMMAFFNSTAEGPMDGNKYIYGPHVKAPPSLDAWHAWSELEAKRDKLLAEVADAVSKTDQAKAWEGRKPDDRLAMLADANNPVGQLGHAEPAAALKKQLQDAAGAFTTTLVAQDLKKPRVTKVLERGEYHLPVGDPLE